MTVPATPPATPPVTLPATLLAVAGLHAGYGRLEVLRGIDLTVSAGELLAVVGANGAGKSTLLRAVSGLIRPTAGTVAVNGNELTGSGAERIARAGLAHVPENRLVFPTLSVADNLDLGGWTRRRDGKARARRATVLDMFPRLAERIGVRAGALSGGEQQMLAIGRALMAEPAVIVLDEPSLGLAPKVVGEIIAALRGLRDSGLAVLLVEQNVRASFSVADRVIVMDRGEVTLTGTPAELADDAQIRAAYFGASVTPADTIPADAIPADTVPEDAVPADTIPADAVPEVPASNEPASEGLAPGSEMSRPDLEKS